MAKDIRTRVVVQGETKGLDRVLQQVLGINEKSSKGMLSQAKAYKSVQTEVDKYQKQLRDLAKRQLDLSKQMVQTSDKASPGYKRLVESLREIKKESRDTEEVIRNLGKAFSDQADSAKKVQRVQEQMGREQRREEQQRRGAFSQGFLQAAAPGMASLFLQRGPGMRRQAMGMAVGGLMSRAVKGGVGMFTGLQGMQQSLSAIPIVGGAVAGQLGAAAGYGQQALAFQRQRMDLTPFMRFRNPTSSGPGAMSEREINIQSGEARQEGVRRYLRLQASITGEPYQGLVNRLGRPGEEALTKPAFAQGQREAASLRNRLTQERNIRLQELERRRAGLGGLEGLGRQLRGLGPQEAMAEIGALFQAGGGRFGTGPEGIGSQRQFLQTALSAKTVFGVGPEVSGAFQMAGRRGGLIGGRGRAPEALTGALREAISLGLEGSEITNYMQQVASGIQQFQTTGIPFSKESVQAMSVELAKGGISGTRATQIAQGFTRYTQQIGTRGPASGRDFMLMQQLGGYTGKGGPEALEQAYINLEQMRTGEGGVFGAGSQMQGFMRRLMSMGGGGAMGRLFLRRQLSQMGIQVGAKEMQVLGKQLMDPASLTPEDRGVIEGERKRLRLGERRAEGMRTPEQLMQTAARLVSDMGPNLRKQAAIQEKQLSVGTSMLKTVQNLEMTSANATKIVANLVEGPMESITGHFEKLAIKLEQLTREGGLMESFMGKLGQFVYQ